MGSAANDEQQHAGAREEATLTPRPTPLTLHSSAFAAHFRVRHYEMDALGHVNNAVYLHYLEQTAIEHATALGFTDERLRDLGGLFIARRHEIDYLRPAVAGDLLCVTTWIGELTAAQAVREYVIARLEETANGALPADTLLSTPPTLPAAPLVRARTTWVWVGTTDGRPRRIPAALRAIFAASGAAAP